MLSSSTKGGCFHSNHQVSYLERSELTLHGAHCQSFVLLDASTRLSVNDRILWNGIIHHLVIMGGREKCFASAHITFVKVTKKEKVSTHTVDAAC